MRWLKQSTAATVLVGPVLDSAGAAYTGMVIGDFNITKNGTTAAMASAATATHSHNGMYLIATTTGNTDTLGAVAISCNKATYAMAPFRASVIAAALFDQVVTNGTAYGTSTLTQTQITGGAYDITNAGVTVRANLVQILGTALTGTAALIAAAFSKFFNVATPQGTVNSLPDHGPGGAGGLPTVDINNNVNGLVQTQTSGGASLITVGTGENQLNVINGWCNVLTGGSTDGNSMDIGLANEEYVGNLITLVDGPYAGFTRVLTSIDVDVDGSFTTDGGIFYPGNFVILPARLPAINEAGRTVTLGEAYDVTITAATRFLTMIEVDHDDVYRLTEDALANGGGDSSGSGAYVVTVTVSNGTGVIENAIVSLTPAGGPTYSATTDDQGVASFSLNAATYTRAIVHPLHSFTPDTITVTEAANFDATLTPIVITPATEPGRTTGYVLCFDNDNELAAGIEITVKLDHTAAGTVGLSHSDAEQSATSIAGGLCQIPKMLQLATYRAKRGDGPWGRPFKTRNTTTTPLPEILGHE